ncbi:hypothetical protein TNCV_969131 [Trichonephila clavipes]|nr:hypothetical protein TNCV_969131 [Trichonephila clavipes]
MISVSVHLDYSREKRHLKRCIKGKLSNRFLIRNAFCKRQSKNSSKNANNLPTIPAFEVGTNPSESWRLWKEDFEGYLEALRYS